MEGNVREWQRSEQCQSSRDEAMGEPGDLPCAQKSELNEWAHHNHGSTRSAAHLPRR